MLCHVRRVLVGAERVKAKVHLCDRATISACRKAARRRGPGRYVILDCHSRPVRRFDVVAVVRRPAAVCLPNVFFSTN
jgi:hypothetical protein